MKKSFFFLMMLSFLFFTACGGEKGSDGESSTTSTEVKGEDPNSQESSETPAENTEVVEENPVDEAPAEEVRDGVLIHISEGPQDPFRVCMALAVAEEMAAENDVLVYFDQRGTEVVFKSTKDFEFNPFPKAKEQIKKLKGMGVQIKVCKPCLQAYFKEKGDVMSGVELSNAGDLTNFTEGKIVSLDY